MSLGAEMSPGALSVDIVVWVLSLLAEAQGLQFLPVICFCPFLQFQLWRPERIDFKVFPPLLLLGGKKLLATVVPSPLSAHLPGCWRGGWQKLIGAWTCVSLCTREKKEKSVTLFKVCWFVSGDLKLLQGKPCVHLGESGYKLTKPLTGGAGGVGMGKSYLFLALGALTVFNQ